MPNIQTVEGREYKPLRAVRRNAVERRGGKLPVFQFLNFHPGPHSPCYPGPQLITCYLKHLSTNFFYNYNRCYPTYLFHNYDRSYPTYFFTCHPFYHY